MFSLGHLSDLHATPLRVERPGDLMNKRLLGWLSWQVKRRKVHRPEVLEALLADLREQATDHVVVTGDLTNVALESEFRGARTWLERIGDAKAVSVVPGNHDAYVETARERSWGLWSDYMAADDGDGGLGVFPALRVRGPVALVGLSSATPTAPFRASGSVGAAQLEQLEALLARLADSELCRVVLIHHPPTEGATTPRRALSDAAALRAVLRRAGADLVLHGHCHRTLVGRVDGPDHPIPVVGVRSSSDVGGRPGRRAQYHVYAVERASAGDAAPRFAVTMRVRGYDPASGRFRTEGERAL